MLNGKGQAVLLVTLRTPISNGALAAESLPTRLKILGWGDNASVKGNVRLSLLSASRIPQSQKENGFEEIALDFEHNTVPGSPEYERTSEPRAVAAYGTPRVIAGEGLFLENIEWTPAGKTSALNYKDLSPAVSFDDLGNIVFVHSVALTRNGAVDGLSFFNSTINQPNKTMDPNTVITVAELAPAIGLSATATKADVLTRFTIFAALLAALPFKDGKIETLSALDSRATALDGRLKKIEDANTKNLATLSATVDGKTVTLTAEDLVKLNTRVETLSATLQAGTESAASAERQRLLDDAAREGKVIPLSADTVKTLSSAALKELIAGLPKNIVPLHARGGKAGDSKLSQLTGLAKAIAAHQAEQT